jgi:hypothetical protein
MSAWRSVVDATSAIIPFDNTRAVYGAIVRKSALYVVVGDRMFRHVCSFSVGNSICMFSVGFDMYMLGFE